MGVYIEGIEMPKDGSWVTLRVFSDGQCVLHSWCGNDDEIKFDFMEHLTAVPVHEPHGRLGDLDALVERIDGIWDCNDMVFRPNDKICKIPEDCKGCKWAQTKDCIQRMVENAPTIIPASEEGET